MGRDKRPDFTDRVVHVMNRANEFGQLFECGDDYDAFTRVLIEEQRRTPLPIIAFCLMPNHWHLLVWPTDSLLLPLFMHRVTLTHAVRWRTHRETVGRGHVYKARYKACIVQPEEEHLLRTQAYVERNALKSGLVRHAVDWPWGSAWHRREGDPHGLLSPGPEPLPAGWESLLDQAQPDEMEERLRQAIRAGAPIGADEWVEETARELGLERTLRRAGRPTKHVAPQRVRID